MITVAQTCPVAARSDAKGAVSLEWIALALMVPMFVSGLVFNTYEVALASLPLEILRQLNAPYLLAELVFIGLAAARGFKPSMAWRHLDRPTRLAAAIFLTVFWIGGVAVSEVAPFATLFNISYLLHVVFGCAVAHLAGKADTGGVSGFGKLTGLLLLFLAIAIAIQFARPPAGRTVESIQWQFALPGFISVRLFGAVMAPCLVFFAWLAVERGNEPQFRRWVLPACTLASGMLCWSGTRAGLLGCAATGLVALGYFRLRMRRGMVLPVACAVIAGGLAGMALAPYGDPAFLLYSPSDLLSADAATGGRLSFWVATWDAYLSVKWFGAGPGATAWILPATQWPHIQPHNIILEFLLNWGLIGAAAAVYLLARLIAALHRRAARDRALVPFVLLADCLLVIAVFDGTFHFAQHLMLGAAAAGIVLARCPTQAPA